MCICFRNKVGNGTRQGMVVYGLNWVAFRGITDLFENQSEYESELN